MSYKVNCDACGCYVVAEGHEFRCRQPDELESSQRQLVRVVAWMGDARHTSDVRGLLICFGVPLAQVQVVAAEYVAAAGQAVFYDQYVGCKHQALGTSVASRATAFEASYFGDFRTDYVRYLCLELSRLDGRDVASRVNVPAGGLHALFSLNTQQDWPKWTTYVLAGVLVPSRVLVSLELNTLLYTLGFEYPLDSSLNPQTYLPQGSGVVSDASQTLSSPADAGRVSSVVSASAGRFGALYS